MQGSTTLRGRCPMVGREAELQDLSAFLSERSSVSGLVFIGEPGIGKTTLWQAGVDMAADRGYRVLSTRASEGEAGLLFAALADLLDGIDPTYLASVPAPQMHALEVALHRIEPGVEAPEPFAIASGFLHAIRALAKDVTPVLAIDDVQWLDRSSADCLLFLARRLTEPTVRFIMSRRGDEPSELERALERVDVTRIHVQSMSAGAICRMVLERFGVALPHRVLRQVHEASQGNPLLALELGRLISECGLPELGSDLPVPNLGDGAFGLRVRALAVPVRHAVLAVALSPGLGRRQLELVAEQTAVEDALDEGLLVIDRDRLRLAHPMLGAAVKMNSSTSEQRRLLLALAQAVDDQIVSSRHLAVATETRDVEIARTVEAASRLAMERGALQEAEELCAHALRLTPAGEADETARVLELARCHLTAGNWSAAASVLEDRMADLRPGRDRALGHLLLGEATLGRPREKQFDLAIAEAGDHAEVRAVAAARKSLDLSINLVERLDEASKLASVAWAEGRGCGQDALLLSARAWALVMRGESPDEVDASVLAESSMLTLDEICIERPAGVRHAFRGDPTTAKDVMLLGANRAGDRVYARDQSVVWVQLCEFALRGGDVAEATGYLQELDQWTGVPEVRTLIARLRAVLAAIQGRPAEAYQSADDVLRNEGGGVAYGWDRLEVKRAVGLAALFEGDWERAVEHLGAVWDHSRREGLDLGAFPAAGDLVEALVGSSRIEVARNITVDLAALATAQDHPWGRATAKRCRAVISVADGDSEIGAVGLADAAEAYGKLTLDFERARCLLQLGRLQRRTKKRAEARRALTDSRDTFDRLGCSGWAQTAAGELDRISGRRANDGPGLTRSEQAVVDLAASGISNKEIAKVLFISVYTVERHLSHAYAKLGLRSRSQLAAQQTKV